MNTCKAFVHLLSFSTRIEHRLAKNHHCCCLIGAHNFIPHHQHQHQLGLGLFTVTVTDQHNWIVNRYGTSTFFVNYFIANIQYCKVHTHEPNISLVHGKNTKMDEPPEKKIKITDFDTTIASDTSLDDSLINSSFGTEGQKVDKEESDIVTKLGTQVMSNHLIHEPSSPIGLSICSSEVDDPQTKLSTDTVHTEAEEKQSQITAKDNANKTSPQKIEHGESSSVNLTDACDNGLSLESKTAQERLSNKGEEKVDKKKKKKRKRRSKLKGNETQEALETEAKDDKNENGTTTKNNKNKYKLQKVPPPDSFIVNVVAPGSTGNPCSVVISTTFSRYLFNCGEGTQRLFSEHKLKLSKVENIFITSKCWKNIGGMLGLWLTLEAHEVPVITIHGPKSVEKTITLARKFAPTGMITEKRELSEELFQDHAVTCQSVPLPHEASIKRKHTESSDNIDMDEDSDLVVAYIMKPLPKQRSLCFEKCVEMGMPRKAGALLGELKDGKDVTLEDGRVIRSEDVLGPVHPNPPVVVLEIPSEAYIKSMVSSTALTALQGPDEESPALIVHMTPEHILHNPNYQQWMHKFPSSTKHLVLNDTCYQVPGNSVYSYQANLNILHDRIFPLLPHQTSKYAREPCEANGDSNVTFGEAGIRYTVRPLKEQYDRELCPVIDNDAYMEEVKSDMEFQQIYKEIQEKLTARGNKEISNFPEVIFLGTGSSIPSKRRNVSAILLRISCDKCILLDCGEGTYGQLYRQYADQTGDILRGLQAIFISHLHADHHMGFYRVIEAREEAFREKELEPPALLYLAPGAIRRWLSRCDNQLLPLPKSMDLVPLEDMWEVNVTEKQNRELYSNILKTLGLSEFVPVKVDHPQCAHGIVLAHEDGWKIVYSGDTKPCDRLIETGKSCDLLIHEATLENIYEEEALAKKHSTTSQAIEVGRKMEAKFTLLTHFSQRYAKLPIIDEGITSNVGIAFDNMRLTLGDLDILPILIPAFKVVFSEDYVLMEERTRKKTLEQESV